MEKHLHAIRKVKIFNGLDEGETIAALSCLSARVARANKGEYIFTEGDKAGLIAAVITGEIQIQKTDLEGNVNIISKLLPPNLVAGAAAYSIRKVLPFDVVAVCESEILLIDSARLTRPCNKVCAFHTRIIENMLAVLSEKNIEFTQKIDILTKRTTREKILAFLHSEAKKTSRAAQNDHDKQPYAKFSITMSRQQMAEYLSINRSALSRELSKMRDEGILDFSSNHFEFKRL